MKSNVVSLFKQPYADNQSDLLRHFESDVCDLLTGARQGHMERWEYWHADYPGDPAGGGPFWDALIKRPGAYYLPCADMDLIGRMVRNPAIDSVLRGIHSVVELGPGSAESIAGKTMPLMAHAKRYVAIDQTQSQAEAAADQISNTLGLPTEAIVCDYLHANLSDAHYGRKGFMMWGGAIANIEGGVGADPLPELVRSLHLLAAGCNSGDTVFVSIDTEQNKTVITDAYNVPLLSQKFLSVLHAAKKFGMTSGKFTPESWTHRSVWHNENWQCAHYLIAGEDQDFMLAGKRIRIAAGQSVITNNSYKFPHAVVREAARIAGFGRAHVSDDKPIAMLMATK